MTDDWSNPAQVTGAAEPENGGADDAWGTAVMSTALPAAEEDKGNVDNGQTKTSETNEAEQPGDVEQWNTAVPYNYDNFSRRDEWEGNARIYEWDGEHGEIGPEFPELETEIFGDRERGEDVAGLNFDA